MHFNINYSSENASWTFLYFSVSSNKKRYRIVKILITRVTIIWIFYFGRLRFEKLLVTRLEMKTHSIIRNMICIMYHAFWFHIRLYPFFFPKILTQSLLPWENFLHLQKKSIDPSITEMPITTEYINQYFKLKMFIMLNLRVLVKLCNWTR